MNLTRTLAMAHKELIQIRRDTRSLIIILIMPVILVLLFGYGVSLDLKHVPVYVFDREGSQQSQDLLKRFQATQYFNLVRTVDNYPALVAAIDSGQAKLGLVLPPDFSQQLENGGPVSVQALVDATDDNAANVIFSTVRASSPAFPRTFSSPSCAVAARGTRNRRSSSKPAPGTTKISKARPSSFRACWPWSCR